MGKTFDDLFNDFFNRRKKTPSVNEEVRKIIDSLMSFKMVESELLSESIQAELGEPDEIIDHVENGVNFKKLIWNTPYGKFVKILVTESEFKKEEKTFERKKHSKSLEQRLKEAVEVEDYELAIQLRDEIKKNRKKYRKKKTDE